MYSLHSVDVTSCAKMMGTIYGCRGLIFLPFLDIRPELGESSRDRAVAFGASRTNH
jgi:hypothetical protein